MEERTEITMKVKTYEQYTNLTDDITQAELDIHCSQDHRLSWTYLISELFYQNNGVVYI